MRKNPAVPLIALLIAGFALAQSPGDKLPSVIMAPVGNVQVRAGASAAVSLDFRIGSEFHINSHTPSEDSLIPTTFSIPDGTGVKLENATYPAGVALTLPADPKTKLNVYTGEFAIQARIVATHGNHLVEAKLRYQACNQSQCLPPRNVAVAIDVIGK